MGRKRIKSKPIWHHIGDGYHELVAIRCYTGTRVLIVPYAGGRYAVRLINESDQPLRPEEVSRQKGSCDSAKTWRSVSGAKRVGFAVTHRLDWLQAAGIVFKVEEEKAHDL